MSLILVSVSWSLPSITSITESADTVGKYEKFEMTVGLTASYSNPFNPAEVDLKSVFTSPAPTLSQWTIFGFCYDTTPSNIWKIRFAANTVGVWNYTVYLTDSTGSTSTTGSFACITSAQRGWVQLSDKNAHYLKYNDGSSYLGLGHNQCWQLENFPTLFPDMKTYGMNVLSYWLAYWDNPLVTLTTNYDRYDMTNAYDVDSIFNAAEQNDIQIMFTVWYHGALRDSSHPWGSENWSQNPFKNINSVCSTFFSDTTSWQYQQNLYRYMLARWGSSRAFGFWHTVSEFNGTMAAPNGNTIQSYGDAWHTKITNYFKTNDPFRHPITASRGDITSWDTGFRVMDLDQAHSYDYPNDAVREAITVGNWTRSTWNSYTTKPNVIGEFGTSDSNLQPAHIHYSNWAGVLAGAAVGPLDWNDTGSFGQMTYPMFTTMRVLRNYVSDIQFDKLNLSQATVSAGSGYAGYGLTNSTTAYFWVMDTTPGETVSGLSPQISSISSLSTGTYRIYWWNTWTGTTISINSTSYTSGSLITNAPSFQKDIAAKAYWVSASISTTPTIVSIVPNNASRDTSLSVVFTGTNYIPSVSSVYFGPDISVNSTLVDSSTQITANITISSTAAFGARDVSVTNPGVGTGTLTNGFTVNSPMAMLVLWDFDISTEGWQPYTTWGSATITGPVHVESTSYNGNGSIRYNAIINSTGWSDVKGASPELNGADWSTYSFITGYIYFPSGAGSIPTRIFTTSGTSSTWREGTLVSVPLGAWTPLAIVNSDIATPNTMHIYGFKVGGSSVSYNGSIYFDYVTAIDIGVPVELSRFEIE
jgi:hypothetical protein